MLPKSLFVVVLLSLGLLEKSIADNQLRVVTNIADEQQNQDDRRLATLKIVGNNGGAGFPLGNCEGDCDNDNECSGSLKCFQRSGNEAVPGCSGDRDSYKGVDFCYSGDGGSGGGDDGGSGGGGGGGSGGFRPKLYWQQGYYWQEERIERKWCLVCRGGCRSGASLYIKTCSSSNTKFQFVGSGRVQIKVAGTNLCMTLVGRDAIELHNCDSGNDRQRFTAGAGSFTGRRFEFNPVVNGGCVSNSHHPKDGEVIYRQTCQRSRASTTSYWNKY